MARLPIVLLLFCNLTATCARAQAAADNKLGNGTTPVRAAAPVTPTHPKGPFYTYLPVKKRKDREAFLAKYPPDLKDVIFKLNRIDRNSLHRLDTLVIPEPLDTVFALYSPFPRQLPWAKDLGKLIVFSYPIQAFAAYNNGEQVHWGPTSMGRRTKKTPTGLYFANWKEEEHVSSIDPDWNMPYTVNLHVAAGIAMHQYSMPGKPASHKCMRLQMSDAIWLFYWVDTWVKDGRGKLLANGTPVIVYGDYNFQKKGPWHYLPKNPAATFISAADLLTELAPHLPQIKEKHLQRQQLGQKPAIK